MLQIANQHPEMQIRQNMNPNEETFDGNADATSFEYRLC